jgi:predicted permease
MHWVRRLVWRLEVLFRKDRAERELQEELAYHLEREIQENITRGMSPAEAKRKATVDFGGMERTKEQVREVRGARGLDDLTRDVRYGFRRLRKHPMSTFSIVVTLALGVGVNASVFSLVNGLLFRHPAAVVEPERMVRIGRSYETRNAWDNFSWPSLLELRRNASVFQDVAGYYPTRFTLGEGADAMEVPAAYVTGNYFGLLGVQPALGRGILPSDDETPGRHPVAVLSHGVWAGRFGADPDVLGRSIRLGSTLFQVVGVAPRGFQGVDPGEAPPQVYVPTTMATLYGDHPPWDDWQAVWIRLVARLAEGVSFEAAEDGLPVITSRLREARQGPEKVVVRLSRGVGLDPDDRAEAERASGLLLAMAGLLLLLACANAANLLLAKGVHRSRELGIRLALGAGRGRITTQLLVESILMGLVATLAAIPLVYVAARSFSLFLPESLSVSFLPDARVFSFLLLLGVATGLLFGGLPAISSAGLDATSVLRGGRNGGTRSTPYLQDSLVVLQLALAMGFLSGSVLLGQSLLRARAADLGFDPSGLLAASVDPALAGPLEETSGLDFYEGLVLGARRLQGVRGATLVSHAPFEGSPVQMSVRTGESPPVMSSYTMVDLVHVGPGYFGVLGIPMVRGRGLPEPLRGQGGAAIVSETAAALLWGEEDPIGQELLVPDLPYEVVGIAGDARTVSLRVPTRPTVYLPLASAPGTRVTLLVRTDGPPLQLPPALRELVADLVPGLPVGRVFAVEQAAAGSLEDTRSLGLLISVLAALSLILASLGLFGLVSHGVSRRVPELGVRMALGAAPGDVVGMVLTRGLTLAALGAALGLGVAFLVGRGLRVHLFDISPLDGRTLAGSVLALAFTGLIASWIPANRASRLDVSRSLNADGE